MRQASRALRSGILRSRQLVILTSTLEKGYSAFCKASVSGTSSSLSAALVRASSMGFGVSRSETEMVCLYRYLQTAGMSPEIHRVMTGPPRRMLHAAMIASAFCQTCHALFWTTNRQQQPACYNHGPTKIDFVRHCSAHERVRFIIAGTPPKQPTLAVCVF